MLLFVGEYNFFLRWSDTSNLNCHTLFFCFFCCHKYVVLFFEIFYCDVRWLPTSTVFRVLFFSVFATWIHFAFLCVRCWSTANKSFSCDVLNFLFMFFKLKGTSWHVSPFILLSVNFDHNNINNLFFSIWCGC